MHKSMVSDADLDDIVVVSDGIRQKEQEEASEPLLSPSEHEKKDTEIEMQNYGWRPIATKADGDCPFHAAFGTWHPTLAMYICDDADAKRAHLKTVIEQIADKKESKESKESSIRKLAYAGIQELIMSGRSIGRETALLREEYQNYLTPETEEAEPAWAAFEVVIEEKEEGYQTVRDFIRTNGDMQNNAIFRNQFFHALNQGNGALRDMIRNIPRLNEAFVEYNENFSTFNWAITPGMLKEYAAFVGRKGQWLLPHEIGLLAYVWNITLQVFPSPAAQPQIFNPNQKETVEILYNGANHYERILRVSPELEEYQQQLKARAERLDLPEEKPVEESKGCVSKSFEALSFFWNWICCNRSRPRVASGRVEEIPPLPDSLQPGSLDAVQAGMLVINVLEEDNNRLIRRREQEAESKDKGCWNAIRRYYDATLGYFLKEKGHYVNAVTCLGAAIGLAVYIGIIRGRVAHGVILGTNLNTNNQILYDKTSELDYETNVVQPLISVCLAIALMGLGSFTAYKMAVRIARHIERTVAENRELALRNEQLNLALVRQTKATVELVARHEEEIKELYQVLREGGIRSEGASSSELGSRIHRVGLGAAVDIEFQARRSKLKQRLPTEKDEKKGSSDMWKKGQKGKKSEKQPPSGPGFSINQ